MGKGEDFSVVVLETVISKANSTWVQLTYRCLDTVSSSSSTLHCIYIVCINIESSDKYRV